MDDSGRMFGECSLSFFLVCMNRAFCVGLATWWCDAAFVMRRKVALKTFCLPPNSAAAAAECAFSFLIHTFNSQDLWFILVRLDNDDVCWGRIMQIKWIYIITWCASHCIFVLRSYRLCGILHLLPFSDSDKMEKWENCSFPFSLHL